MQGVRGVTTPKPYRPQQKHGFNTMKRALSQLGNRALEGRSEAAKTLAEWRERLIADLGGDVSTQQSAIIDLVIKSKIILDSIDVWLLSQKSIINHRKRTLFPVVMQRQAIAAEFRAALKDLGLERRAKETNWIEELNKEAHHDSDSLHGEAGEGSSEAAKESREVAS